MIESLVLAVLSGAAGLLISAWIIDLAATLSAIRIPLLETARLGWSGLWIGATLALMVGQGMRPIAVGIIVGVVTAIGLTRFLSKLLFHVRPLDAVTFIVMTVVLVVIGVVACWIPAARASSVDPLTSLRAE